MIIVFFGRSEEDPSSVGLGGGGVRLAGNSMSRFEGMARGLLCFPSLSEDLCALAPSMSEDMCVLAPSMSEDMCVLAPSMSEDMCVLAPGRYVCVGQEWARSGSSLTIFARIPWIR
jgi:hypothetical protein